MKLLIFGATGATGRLLVDQALELGHAVTAFVRDPARLHRSHPTLRQIVGDAMDAATVEGAVQGHDAVVCALGTSPEGKADRARRQPGVPVCSVGTANIVGAMDRHGVRRIVVESSTSVGESRKAGRWGAAAIVRLFLREVMDDKERQDEILKGSGLDWTIVRPAKLSNGPQTGRLKSGEGLAWSLASSASRADVAAFLLAALGDPATIGRAITVRN